MESETGTLSTLEAAKTAGRSVDSANSAVQWFKRRCWNIPIAFAHHTSFEILIIWARDVRKGQPSKIRHRMAGFGDYPQVPLQVNRALVPRFSPDFGPRSTA